MKLLKFLKFLSVVTLGWFLFKHILNYNSLGIEELRVCFISLVLLVFVNDIINYHMKNKTNDVILNMSWQLDKIKDIICDMVGIDEPEIIKIPKDNNDVLKYNFSEKYGIDKFDERSEYFIKEFTVQDIIAIFNATGGAELSNCNLEIRYSDDSTLMNKYSKFSFNFKENKKPIILDGQDLSNFIDSCMEFLRKNNINK